MGIENIILSDSCFEEYIELVHKVTGITIAKNRKSMLVGRIRKQLTRLKLKSYEEYLQLVKEDHQEKEQFINAMTTNETYFYRTPRVWDFIINEFLTKWDSKKKLKVWSAASSTGEEAHTLGIVFQDYKSNHFGFQYNILGTDISSEVVTRAQKGSYIGRSVERFRNTRPDLFQKYMNGDDENGHRVVSEIKSNLRFNTHNLFDRFKENEKFDLILLRNVLIYFNKEDQQRVLKNIHKHLSTDGYLIIGESESLSQLETNFESVSPLIYKSKIKSKVEEAA